MKLFAAVFLALSMATVALAGAQPEWQAGAGYRWSELSLPPTGRTHLQSLTPTQTGINFTNYLSEEAGLKNSLLFDGSGVAAGDVDGDGWCDLYFCGKEGRNALYRNLGNWRFEDVTASAGVGCEGQQYYSTGAVFADVDGDGDLDLLVTSLGGGTRLFLNDGKGHFTESTNSGLVRRFGSKSMALADIDGNGTLDLYVANYATTKIEDRPNAKFEAKIVNGQTILTSIDGVPTSSPELTNRYFVDATKIVRELGEPDFLYLNDGHGNFSPVSWTDGSFLDVQGKPLTLPPYDFGLSVMFRDLNGDGAPDIYVCNDLFPPDRIWLNDGRGRFRALPNLAIRHTSLFSMGLDFADIDRDGYDDFLVLDMLSPEHQHQKMQVFGMVPMVTPPGQQEKRLQYMRNTLQHNRGDGTYAEIAQLSGLDATGWSWMPLFLDIDLDGFEDLLIVAGHMRDSLNADIANQILNIRSQRRLSDAEQRALKKRLFPAHRLPSRAYRNGGDLSFQDKSADWGFDYVGIAQCMCLADLDNDGDLDVIVNAFNDTPLLYRNESIAPRVAVRLKGRAPNTRGIGAKIRFLGGPVPQSQEMICGGRYLSCDDAMRVFAAGRATNGLSIEVTWRIGSVSTILDVQPNRLYEIDEVGAKEAQTPKSKVQSPAASAPSVASSDTHHAPRTTEEAPNPQSAIRNPQFVDASSLLHHTHVDAWVDDFERQPLLSRKLSQLGPGVSWYDVDGDGWEDLIVGSGNSGALGVFRNDQRGGFERWDKPPYTKLLDRDQSSVLGWRKMDGQTVLLAGSCNYEDGVPAGSIIREFNAAKPQYEEHLPGWEISVGPLAMADLDGDGILDLFVGGRVVPGRFPEAASSLMFRGNGDKFMVDTNNSRQLGLVGMVSGAVFSDLDGDGFPELIVACDWGPIKIFRNNHGRLSPWNPPVSFADAGQGGPGAPRITTHNSQLATLSQLTGWWNGVTTGDFDGDGKMDIVASNWGRNTKYQAHREQPLRVYYGEWSGRGGYLDLLEAYYETNLQKWVPACSYAAAKSMPWVAEQFPTHQAFGAAGVADLLGARAAGAAMWEAAWLETTVFLNRGDHFEVRVLPLEAQFAPAFGISVGDLDGDGQEDIFLSQNFFAVDKDSPRYDAGRGLLLAGDGRGSFRPVPGQESGLKIYGEQRGCALCDYDGDGRTDLVVGQNAAETKLFRNVGARPGLRVRLKGPPGNPYAVGAVLRLWSGGAPGPAREVHAGSGYWSQDSATQVMAGAETPERLWVRWPGGKETTVAIPAGSREIVVDGEGRVESTRR